MSLGVVVPYWWDRPPMENLAVAKLADRYGYDELWAGEMDSFDAFSFAGAAARETKRLTVTVGPLAVGVRTPVLMAMGAASVGELGGRPARLALGVSTRTIVELWHGRSWTEGPQRLSAAIDIVRTVLAGERSAREESPAPSRGFRLTVFPPRPIHITVAAFGPQATAVAAAEADRAVSNLVTTSQVAAQRSRLDELGGPPLALWLAAAVDPGPDALSQLASQVSGYLAAPGYGEMFMTAGFPEVVTDARSGKPRRDLAAALPVELLQAVAAIGSKAEVAARIDAYRTAGAADIAIVPVTGGDPAGESTLVGLAGL